MPVLDHINLIVRDMDAMSDFYHRLGLQIETPPPDWAPHHRSAAGDGGVEIHLDSEEFTRVWDQGWQGGSTVVVNFRTESRAEVDRLYRELTAAGYAAQQPPYDAFWGARYAVVCDPDGNAVGLMSQVDAERRTSPPTPPFA